MNPNSKPYSLYLLGATLAVGLSSHFMLFTFASLAALHLGASTSQATLPLFLGHLGALTGTLPLSLAMNRFGRKPVFLGTTFGAMASGGFALWSLHQGSLIGFCLSFFLFGGHQAGVLYYRFAALEIAPPGKQKIALGLVFSGGVIASLLGPWLSRQADQFSRQAFEGGFIALAALWLLQALLLTQIRFPQTKRQVQPLREMLKLGLSPALGKPIALGALSYGIMIFLMIGTPITMKAKGFDFAAITLVIQWHMLGMYLPSLATGRALQRLGERRVALAGALTLLGSIAAGLAGDSLWHFLVSMTLVGVGWNLGYLAATSLLAKALRPEETALGQGVNEFLVLAVSASCSLTSGMALAALGWNGLLWASLPFVGAMLLLFMVPQRQTAQD